MGPENNKESSLEFNFLNETSRREPNIVDVLREIALMQSRSLPEGTEPLATIEHLKKSRNIRIPYTTARDNQIAYLVDHLLRNYPGSIKTITTFDFNVDTATKKLDVIEKVEYTVMLNDRDFNTLQSARDAASLHNILAFISKFRIVNLSKLLKKASQKNELSRLIKLELGKSIFTFKHYRVDKNKIEYAEDYCFHAGNYNNVKNSFNLDKLKNIVKSNSELVMRRLKKYGILNSEFSDYRDSKLEYIFHILEDDLGTSLPESDLIEVKNDNALRGCLLKVDKILDPVQTLSADIVGFIREHGICPEATVSGSLPDITPEILKKWETPENLRNNYILKTSHDDTTLFIDGTKFIDMITDVSGKIIYNPELMNNLPYPDKQKTGDDMEILYTTAKEIFTMSEPAEETLNTTKDKIDSLKTIIDDYEQLKKQQSLKKDMVKIESSDKKAHRSFVEIILGFFKSLFGLHKKIPGEQTGSGRSSAKTKKEMSKETRRVYEKVADLSAPVLPLSDFIDVSPDNDLAVDTVINDLRNHNIKAVIPIYSARTVLYPKRSQKLIIPDIEYLLVSPDVCKSPDDIRAFADSLAGYKLKDEVMPGKAIMTVEKYLLTIYRQKRATQFKKEL
ncbi:MAG TPA: hypothetical protein PK544_00565 [Spirochaetota bacterium]|nr:hypothetical protein [Spirochaetota bacterium]HPJ39435.1 hypothetical protein [Spirochaetota bacterium]HPQ52653.1 hypothetical protein [Spirochaetota bacterium]